MTSLNCTDELADTCREPHKAGRGQAWWMLIFAAFLAWSVALSLIWPLGLGPDEPAHVQYIRFLSENRTLPVWQASGGGNAGYEAQQPILFYALGALVDSASAGLSPEWRWQLLRFFCIFIGSMLFLVARGFFLDYFHGRAAPAMAATAALMLTPIVLEYSSYVNVDILSMLFSAVVLWMCLRVARGSTALRDHVILAAAFGLGMLTKLTVFGCLPMVVMAYLWRRNVRGLVRSLCWIVLVAGWWYARNSYLYGGPYVHTKPQAAPGLDLVLTGGGYFPHYLWLTLSRTFRSTWVEAIWLPRNIYAVCLYLAVLGLVAAAAVLAVRGRRLPAVRPDPAPWLCGTFIVSLVLAHQCQVWLVDYGWNAGGRYIMNALPAVNALVISAFGIWRHGRALRAAWIGIFVIIDVACICRMLLFLNDFLRPGWGILRLPL